MGWDGASKVAGVRRGIEFRDGLGDRFLGSLW